MNNKVKISLAIAFAFVSIFISVAQDNLNKYNPVTTATPFLTISADSRSSAMGDVGVSTSPDINSQAWNPAKYAFIEDDFGVSFSYTPWLRELVNDIGLSYISGFKRLDDQQAVSASMRYFSLGAIQWTDNLGTELGEISPNEFALDASYSRLFSDNWSGAVTFRYIHSDLTGGARVDVSGSSQEYGPGNSFATDISVYHRGSLKKTTTPVDYAVGLNISNIGAKISYTDGADKEFLPTTFRLGTSWTFEVDDYNTVTATAEMSKLLVPTSDPVNDPGDTVRNATGVVKALFSSWNDAPRGFEEELEEIMLSVGVEYLYAQRFAIRGGYFHENQYKGNRQFFSVGAGFEMNVFALDVSYLVPMDAASPLANTLRFSLSFGVDGIRNLMGR